MNNEKYTEEEILSYRYFQHNNGKYVFVDKILNGMVLFSPIETINNMLNISPDFSITEVLPFEEFCLNLVKPVLKWNEIGFLYPTGEFTLLYG